MKEFFPALALPIAAVLVHTQSSIAADLVYKIELRETPLADVADDFAIGKPYQKEPSRSEWAVITVTQSTIVQIKQATRLSKPFGLHTWIDHAVTAVRVCKGTSRDLKNCTVYTQNTFTLPKGSSVKDFIVDFRFTEDNVVQQRSVQVPRNRLPEEL